MNQFFIAPSIKALLTNPPPISVWWNAFLYKLQGPSLRPNYTPLSVVIYTTKRCNFKCEFCFTYDSLNRENWRSFELTAEELTNILDSEFGLRALRIGLLGGEPFMNPHIFEFLDECHKRGKITTVVSNASLIGDEERSKLLSSFPTMLGLSWYENNEEKIFDLSRWLSENRKSFWVQTVIGRREIPQMREKLLQARRAGIKNLIFSNYNPFYSKDVDNVIFDDCEEYLEIGPELLNLADQFDISLVLPQPIKRNPSVRSCQMPFSYVHVDNKGTLGACCFRPPDLKFGNIFEPTTWQNDANTAIRSSFLNSSSSLISPCTYCENLSRDLYGV